MAFQKAVKGTALIGGGAIATVFGLSQFSQHRNKHVKSRAQPCVCLLKCFLCSAY
uniref:Uncharacterized protein n=1 Tax=Zonotrichia albicollis TaxID=44394 RepID=A0A8D2MU24_ZONAL